MAKIKRLSIIFLTAPMLIAVLISVIPEISVNAKSGFENDYQNDYANIRWSTEISKKQVINKEQFHATVDLVSDIKQIRGDAVKILGTLVNPLSPNAIVTWEIIAQTDDRGKEISLGTYQAQKPLPKLEPGSTLQFRNERIPTNGALSFPNQTKSGKYTLWLRFVKVEAKASVLLTTLSRDITEVTRDYLPPKAYGPGIRLGEIDLIEPPHTEIAPPRVIATTPVNGAIDVPVDTAIRVNFDEPLSPNPTDREFTISPEVPGEITRQHDTLIFIPAKNLSYNNLYRVTVGDVTDLSQTALDEPYTWEFTTESAPSRWWIFWSIIGAITAIVGIGLLIMQLRRRQRPHKQ